MRHHRFRVAIVVASMLAAGSLHGSTSLVVSLSKDEPSGSWSDKLTTSEV